MLVVSQSPHIHDSVNTRRVMADVLIALAPAFVLSVYVFGIDVLTVTAVSVLCCVVLEYSIQRFLLKTRSSVGDLSAVVTGVLLAFNLPSTIPLWMVAVGAVMAIGVTKMTFGGLGKNLFNPALVGRVFLLISFPQAMTSYPPVDGFSGATPLEAVREMMAAGQSAAEAYSQFAPQQLLFGFTSGSFGEVGALALMAGFVWLLIRRDVSWYIPVAVLGSVALFSGIMWIADPQQYMNPLFHILTGGIFLGALFMATDYVTSPMTRGGMIVFGVGIGVITMLIRYFGAYPEGVSFAILIMNACVPLIDKGFRPRRYGSGKLNREQRTKRSGF